MEDALGLRQRLNDDRRKRFGESGRLLALLCECGDPECTETVLLTRDAFDARRPGTILHPAHAGVGLGDPGRPAYEADA